MATKIARTGTSSTNATKFTWSAWVKRANIGSGGMMIYNYLNGDNRAYLQFQSDDKIYYYDKDGGDIQASLTTTAVYRDPNAFYHICLIGDSTDGTQGDRIQLYINGVRQSMSGTYPDASDSLGMKVHTGTNYHVLGTNSESTSNPFLGIMSHVHYVDGIDYPATTFGSTDATTGEWKINTSPSITTSDYGNNGYFVLKDGNSVTDQSGNSHNFTVTSGTLTKTEDCPSSVFCTWNPLVKTPHTLSYYRGNLDISAEGNSWYSTQGTLGFSQGKFYFECTDLGADSMIGVCNPNIDMSQSLSINLAGTTVFYNQDGGEMRKDGTATTADYGTFNSTDIMGVAIDMDNKTMSIYKNNSAIVTNYALSTSITDTAIPYVGLYASGNLVKFNFGNGYFGTTAVSSAGTNASNNGIFEYDVPTGYTALSTKGLNL